MCTQEDKQKLYELSKNYTYKQIAEITGFKIPTITKVVQKERRLRNEKRRKSVDCNAKSIDDCLNCKFKDCIKSSSKLLEFEKHDKYI